MSYDINQSQGIYNDGRNQLAGQPALNQPVSPGQIPLVPEESMWRKYSSHYEFPISILLAVLLHVVAVLVVIAYMALAFYFGEPKPPDMETIVIAGGGGDGDGVEEEFKPDVNDEIKVELEEVSAVIPPDTIPDLIPKKNEFELESKKLRPGDKGLGGGGTGGGKGEGHGRGIGDGVGDGVARGGRLDRQKRWVINLSYVDSDAFIEKLANLKIVVGARFNSGRYFIFETLTTKPPVPYKEMTLDEFSKYMNKAQKIFFQDRKRIDCENFGLGVNIAERPTSLFLLIPQDLEQAILAKEISYHGFSENEVKKRKLVTTFSVQRTSSGWDVRVEGAKVDPTLKFLEDPSAPPAEKK
jgi:hypothetical protein